MLMFNALEFQSL